MTRLVALIAARFGFVPLAAVEEQRRCCYALWNELERERLAKEQYRIACAEYERFIGDLSKLREGRG